MENYKNDYEGTLLNIIVFNDKYTTKWSNNSNYLQLKMFYQMALNFQKKLK
jgi:hypothetical protein